MSTELQCQCVGMTRLGGLTCPQPCTQEDGLCDKCRAMDCPTVTWSNLDQRVAEANAKLAAWGVPLIQYSTAEVPF